jgi:hypothetical protein
MLTVRSRALAGALLGVVLCTQPLLGQGARDAGGTRSNGPWPIKTREHVDLWLHGYALLLDDTAAVPLFRRGYRDSLIVERNRLNRISRLDQQRDSLIRGLRTTPALFGSQFLALHFAAFEPMRASVMALAQAGSDPRRVPSEARIAAAYFQTAPTRAWASAFTEALGDESQTYFRAAWLAAQRERAPVLALADSLWRGEWFPRLRPFIRGSDLRGGELIASVVVDAEGRTITADPQLGPTLVVGLPQSPRDVNQMLFGIVHELAGSLAQREVLDNITPRQARSGLADQLLPAAVLHAGMMVLQRAMPDRVDGYARYYLRASGKALPPTGVHASAALAQAFPVPSDIISAMKDKLDVMFAGL